MSALRPEELGEYAARAAEALRVDTANGGFEDFLRAVGPDGLRVTRAGGRLTAGAGFIRSAHAFGGRSAPAALVTAVWAAPHVRGRGTASALLREVLEELRAAGFPLSSLYPANLPLYRGLGYEVAASNHVHTARLAGFPTRAAEGWTVAPLDDVAPEAPGVLAELYEAARPHLGAASTDRTPPLWHGLLGRTQGEQVAAVAAVDPSGEPRGYALAQTSHRDATVRARELIALEPDAARTLLAHLAGYRGVFDRVTFPGGAFHPFGHLLRDPPSEVRTSPAMFRLLDVERALAGRGYPCDLHATIELDVRDQVLPANAGRVTLELDGSGAGTATPGGRGDVALDVRELAVLYTGHATPRELMLAGPPAVLDALARAFAGPRPWIADAF